MPRTSKKAKSQTSQAQTMAGRLKAGRIVPLISNTFNNDLVLGGHDSLVEQYARRIDYALSQKNTLPRLVQYKSIMDDLTEPWELGIHYIDFIKNHLFDLAEDGGVNRNTLAEVEDAFDEMTFSEFSESLGYPLLDSGQIDPLLILADFPLPIYLTTSYHNFIEVALRRAGKTPHSEICRWHDGLKGIPSAFDQGYEPNKYEPLVYHLHGFDSYPESLVLTEDNHLEFLVAISEYKGKDQDLIDGRIRQALVQSALVLLGYSLQDWDFRSLFWGLIKQRAMKPKSVSVQIKPDEDEKRYLEQYLAKAEFEVFWGDPQQYIQQLRQEWEG